MTDLIVRGISRSAGDERELCLCCDRDPTDDEMRLIHDILRESLARGDAYRGAREDMEIWKKRALEAEATIDKMWRQNNAENGPPFMGEPSWGASKVATRTIPAR